MTRRMLIECEGCGVVVLDVDRDSNPYFEGGLLVRPRSVPQSKRKPGQRPLSRYEDTPGDDDPHSPTYSWTCKGCRRPGVRRHSTILAAWPPDGAKSPRVLRLRLGRDL